MSEEKRFELLANIIEALGARLEKIVVNDLRDHTFIATLYLRRHGEQIQIDSRPSDAIALGSAFDARHPGGDDGDEQAEEEDEEIGAVPGTAEGKLAHEHEGVCHDDGKNENSEKPSQTVLASSQRSSYSFRAIRSSDPVM